MQIEDGRKTVAAGRCGHCDQAAPDTIECAGATCTLKLCAGCRGASGRCADCDAEAATHAQRAAAERLELAEILLAGARLHIGASPRTNEVRS